MKILIFGATGATGRLALRQAVEQNIETRIVVRNIERVPENLRTDSTVECIVGNVSEYGPDDMKRLIRDCDAVISCLGHNLTFKGLFGKPRLLVTDTVKKIVEATKKSEKRPFKFILMSTVAFRHDEANEQYKTLDKTILSLLLYLLPPHRDNVKAARYLIDNIGQDNQSIEWVAVRPDTLIDEAAVSPFDLYASPVRSPVTDPGQTSRINVGRFMIDLLTDAQLWDRWKFRLPVIYNRETKKT